MKQINKCILILSCLIITACSGTRHLPHGEKLYVGAKIKLESEEKIDQRSIKSAAEEALRPEPNKSYFGMRPKLMLYNAAGEHPKSKLEKWMKRKGEAPVLMRAIKPGATATIIDAKLFNLGIFKSDTESEIVEKKHTGQVIYTSHVHHPFVIGELIYDISDDSLSNLILAEKNQSIIKSGDNYNLDLLTHFAAILKRNAVFQ